MISFYFIYKLAWVLTNILPIRVVYRVAELCSDMQYIFARKDRQAVAENLKIILNRDIHTCHIEARKVFRNFGLYLVDFFRMERIDKGWVERHVAIQDIENINSALKRGRGVISVTAHIGNWEMGGVIAAILGYNISAVALNHADRRINKFFIRQRETKGLKVIPIDSMMKRCVSILKKNGILALLGDRDFTGTGVQVDFFGIPTHIPKGPALLSLRTGAAIVPAFFIRESRFRYRLLFKTPIYPEEYIGKAEDKSVINISERFIKMIEEYIRRYPDQWLVFRRFWESPVDAFIL